MITFNHQLLVLITILYIDNAGAKHTTSFPIGGLFNQLTSNSSLQAYINSETSKAQTYHGRHLYSRATDSYSTSLELCAFTADGRGVVALVDARPTGGVCDAVCLLCNRLNIVHLSLGWEPPETLAEDYFTFAYHPPPALTSRAYAALVKDELQWDKFTILYEDEDSFVRLQELINSWPSSMEPILFRKLYPERDNRETFKYIFKVARMTYHVLDCDLVNVRKYMTEITQVENATEYHSFVLANLDAYTQILEDIPALMANVSTLHLTPANKERWKDKGMDINNDVIRVETALVADALNHIEIAIRSITEQPPSLYLPELCAQASRSEYTPWEFGAKLREALVQTTVSGFTGNISFDEEGKRTNFILHYSKLNEDSKFIHVGFWDSQTNVISTENKVADRSSALKSNYKMRVVSRIGEPYFYTNGTAFWGYAVDLIEKIFEKINREKNLPFEHEFYRVQGDKYGNPVAGTKKWDGLIGELLEHKADLAICDLTITAERNAVVGFSIPFMTLGISMLFKEPEPEDPDMFSFIQPLSLDVWLYLATTYVIVSFVLLICARMCEDDWVNPHPCNQNPENLQNIWSLYNCMWLTMGAIMTQGCDILPRAAGSRWVAGVWWFFALIMTASYTANMSTFLSNSRRSTDIKEVKDLAEQNEISYGAVYNASTYKFFKQSNDSVYSKIWSVMSSAKPTVFANNNEEGRDRVLASKGNYAFFMESTAIEFFSKRNCQLKMVGSKLDSKEYGIAMPKNFPHKELVDNAILKLQESGELEDLKKKWWEDENESEDCEKKKEAEDDSGSLQMENTSGIFLVLVIGGALGLCVAVIDFLLHARQISVKEKVTFWEALASEWRASLNPRELHKAVAPPRSAPPSTATPSPQRERSRSRAASVLRAATSFINFDEIY